MRNSNQDLTGLDRLRVRVSTSTANEKDPESQLPIYNYSPTQKKRPISKTNFITV